MTSYVATGPQHMVLQEDKGQCGRKLQWLSTEHCQSILINSISKLVIRVNLNFGEDEDEGPHEDLNEHEVSEEASDSDGGQQEFDESSDEEVEVSADDNNSQGQQDELRRDMEGR